MSIWAGVVLESTSFSRTEIHHWLIDLHINRQLQYKPYTVCTVKNSNQTIQNNWPHKRIKTVEKKRPRTHKIKNATNKRVNERAKRANKRKKTTSQRETNKAINITKDKNDSLHYFMRWKINCCTPGWVSRSSGRCCCWPSSQLLFHIQFANSSSRVSLGLFWILVFVSVLFGNSLSHTDIYYSISRSWMHCEPCTFYSEIYVRWK